MTTLSSRKPDEVGDLMYIAGDETLYLQNSPCRPGCFDRYTITSPIERAFMRLLKKMHEHMQFNEEAHRASVSNLLGQQAALQQQIVTLEQQNDHLTLRTMAFESALKVHGVKV